MALARKLEPLDAGGPSTAALATCEVTRALHGTVEIVKAASERRSFPARLSEGLGICLKNGAAHDVRADGRLLRYPANALCIRAPGCVWSTDDTGPSAFLSLDLYGAQLPVGLSPFPMTFVPCERLPLQDIARSLLTGTGGTEAVVDLLSRLHDLGVIAAEELREDAHRRCALHARGRLEAEFRRPPTLGVLAEDAGTNRFALLRSFRRAFGVTPHAFLTTLRIEHARNSIAGGAELIEVAHDLGFADQPHFTRAFKRVVGVTPGQYARSVQFRSRVMARGRRTPDAGNRLNSR